MSIYVKNILFYSTLLATIAIWSTTAAPAYAQRDAGAKARGEFGTGSWNSKSESRSNSLNRTDTHRSYSYEPTAAVAGCQSGASHVAPAEHVAAQPQVVRRSFSYEPSYRSSRSFSSPKKESWQYPKTDPRRYRP